MSELSGEETTLDRCAPGTSGVIAEVSGSQQIRQRLLELGFVPGTIVHVVKLATLGDPIQVRVRGYHLSLRKSEAKTVTITRNDFLKHQTDAQSENPLV